MENVFRWVPGDDCLWMNSDQYPFRAFTTHATGGLPVLELECHWLVTPQPRSAWFCGNVGSNLVENWYHLVCPSVPPLWLSADTSGRSPPPKFGTSPDRTS